MGLNGCVSIVGVTRGGSHPNGSIIYPPHTTPYDNPSRPPHRKLRVQPSPEGGDLPSPEFAPPSGDPHYSRGGRIARQTKVVGRV